jgi:hydroxymethylbilane synthase
MRSFTVGTRGSALALWQTRHVTSLLSARAPQIAERIITTRGDTSQAEKLAGKLEKGFFTEELETALREKQIDWAVHSLKDLPTRNPAGLVIGATLTRASPSDLLLVRPDALDEKSLFPVKAGGRVGSSSLRREAMIKHFAPGVSAVPLRGNVPTRVEKLKAGQFEGILLARAGIDRLNLDLRGLEAFELNPRRWACAPGQGAIAVQCREGDAEVLELLATINHPDTARAVNLERSLLRVLEGGCTTPFGCYAEPERATLGLLTDDGWKMSIVPLRASTTDEANLSRWIADLSTSPTQENTHDWLTRRL